jgi:hypothetical protein
MIDLWEVIGRMLTDEEFREAVLGANVCKKELPDKDGCWDIPESAYNKMLSIVRTRMDGPISLMALGEMIVSQRFASFGENVRTAAVQIYETSIPTHGRDSNFYIALGAMALDEELRKRLQHEHPNHAQFDAYGFKRVSHDDRRALLKIFHKGDKAMEIAFNAVCHDPGLWVPDCNDKMIYWKGHKHPGNKLADDGSFQSSGWKASNRGD